MMFLAKLMSSGWLLVILFAGFLVYLIIRKPKWFGMERKYESPFYPFKQWTWQTPPENWSTQFWQCLIWMVLFGCLAFWLIVATPNPWPYALLPAFMSAVHGFGAGRLYIRVKKLSAGKERLS